MPRPLKRVTVKVLCPDGRMVKKILRCPPGRHVNDAGIEKLLDQFAESIEKDFPGVDYKLVELAEAGCFNFVPA